MKHFLSLLVIIILISCSETKYAQIPSQPPEQGDGGGIEGSGGGDYKSYHENSSWFLFKDANRSISYCIEKAQHFEINPIVIDEFIKLAFANWFDYIKLKQIKLKLLLFKRHRSLYFPSAAIGNVVPSQVNTQPYYNNCNGEEDVIFKFGTDSVLDKNLYSHAIAYGIKKRRTTSPLLLEKRFHGFIWITDKINLPSKFNPYWKMSDLKSKGKLKFFPWTAARMNYVLTHEIAQIFGMGDAKGTIVDFNAFTKDLSNPNKIHPKGFSELIPETQQTELAVEDVKNIAGQFSGQIDRRRELYICWICEDMKYKGSFYNYEDANKELVNESLSRLFGFELPPNKEITLELKYNDSLNKDSLELTFSFDGIQYPLTTYLHNYGAAPKEYPRQYVIGPDYGWTTLANIFKGAIYAPIILNESLKKNEGSLGINWAESLGHKSYSNELIPEHNHNSTITLMLSRNTGRLLNAKTPTYPLILSLKDSRTMRVTPFFHSTQSMIPSSYVSPLDQ